MPTVHKTLSKRQRSPTLVDRASYTKSGHFFPENVLATQLLPCSLGSDFILSCKNLAGDLSAQAWLSV